MTDEHYGRAWYKIHMLFWSHFGKRAENVFCGMDGYFAGSLWREACSVHLATGAVKSAGLLGWAGSGISFFFRWRLGFADSQRLTSVVFLSHQPQSHPAVRSFFFLFFPLSSFRLGRSVGQSVGWWASGVVGKGREQDGFFLLVFVVC